MRRPPLPLLVLAALVVPGALAAPALSSKSKTVTVKIGEDPHFFFVKPNPAVPTITVHKGDRVRWHWCPDTDGCSTEHNVVGSLGGKVKFKHPHNASEATGITSGSYAKTFTRTGTYRVLCTIHGFSMKVKVR